MFYNDQDKQLKYAKTSENDKPRPEGEGGYLSMFSGDSGSPYWMTFKDNRENEDVTAIIAVQQGVFHTVGDDDEVDEPARITQGECRQIATKLTNDILEWIKDKSGITSK